MALGATCESQVSSGKGECILAEELGGRPGHLVPKGAEREREKLWDTHSIRCAHLERGRGSA